jgi:hypothetical protein
MDLDRVVNYSVIGNPVQAENRKGRVRNLIIVRRNSRKQICSLKAALFNGIVERNGVVYSEYLPILPAECIIEVSGHAFFPKVIQN